jgi:hypothetical protein
MGTGASVLRATVGAGWKILAMEQLRKIPAIEEGPELPSAVTFSRGEAGGALGLVEDLS